MQENKDQEHLSYKIKKKDGSSYSVRKDRHRYFFPHEWKKFIATIDNPKHYIFFLTSLHTGGRAMEIINLRVKNFDFERQTVTFSVVKQRKAKKAFFSMGKSRTFFVTDKFLKEVKSYLKRIDAKPEDFLFMDPKAIPAGYDNLTNKDKKAHYRRTESAYLQLLKRKLRSSGIKDWNNFSLHNIRKTYGNWMRIYDIRTEEICYRLGHDIATYMVHYGSPMIFTPQEKIDIMNIMGSVK